MDRGWNIISPSSLGIGPRTAGGVGLTVGGAISLGVGLLLTSATFMVAGGPKELTPAKIVSLSLLGVGAASTVAGIDLLAISRNRVAVSLARARAE